MAFNDLREWIDDLEERKDLTRVRAEVDWDEEIGAITREVSSQFGPALLFENIKDHQQSFCRRLFTNGTGTRERVCRFLGVSKKTSYRELVPIFKDRFAKPLKPVTVKNGPVKENIIRGDQIDLFQLPVPKWNPHDGGRYICTSASIVTRDPESGVLNVGTYRGMIAQKNTIGVLLAMTTLDHYHNEKFIFNNDFSFNDRYDGETNYFEPSNERYLAANNRQWIWETNFIPDARKADIDAQEQKGAGVNITQFEISNNILIGHLAEWPVGRYHKAHYHGGGAVLVILRSEGYSLMWPNDLGTRPYEKGQGNRVVRVDWIPGSAFSPPTNWYHQHFNTGVEPALQLALRCGSQKFPLGIRIAAIRAGVYTSVKQGGTLIEYEDEDPEIRRTYEAELEKKGIAPDMNYAAAANEDF